MIATVQTPYINEVLELKRQVAHLEAENKALSQRNYELTCAEQERDIALDEYRKSQEKVATLEMERDHAHIEMNRASVESSEARKLKQQIASIMAICAIPHDQALDSRKLAWIAGSAQVQYSAGIHGGPDDVMLTSMKQWNIAIGGSAENTNKLNDALKSLEAGGAITRTKVECPDGRTHYSVTFDENLLRHPRMFQKPGEPNKHNGGDKRCPQCGGFCKRNLKVSYECPQCGIDFDRDMNPVDSGHAPVPTPEPEPQPVEAHVQARIIIEEEPDIFNGQSANIPTDHYNSEPIFLVPRPRGCKCGIHSRWEMRNGKPYCTNCSPLIP